MTDLVGRSLLVVLARFTALYVRFSRFVAKHAGAGDANWEAGALLLHGLPSERDGELLTQWQDREPKLARHRKIFAWIATFGNTPECAVLEVGSRQVQVPNEFQWQSFIPNCDYTGFDVLDGKNVDVVGDAHLLDTYFPANSFDVVVSSAVFEHLAMPWVVAENIARLLKVGGHVAIETHFSYAEHELPWHFFQFNANALEMLFNPSLGFEIVDSGMSNPLVGRFSQFSDDYLVGQAVPHLYCHSSIIARKVAEPKPDFQWRDVLGDIKDMYPSPSTP